MFREYVGPDDEKQKGVFSENLQGKYRKYVYEIDSYQAETGGLLFSITVLSVGGKASKVISRCDGVELAADEDGIIYSYDFNGNMYTFDSFLNVIKINPFKTGIRNKK